MSYPSSSQIEQNNMYIYDFERGFVIDPITGEVVDQIYVNQVMHRDRETNDLVKTYEFLIASNPLHPLYLQDSRYRCFREIMYLFEDLRRKMLIPISNYEVETTLRYILKTLPTRPFTYEFKASLLSVVLEILGVTVDIKVLSKAFEVPLHVLKSGTMYVKRMLYEKGFNIKRPLAEKVINYIRLFGEHIGLPHKVVASAIDVVKSKPYPSKFTPKTLAVAILYCELERNNINIVDKVPGTTTNLRALMKLTDTSAPPTKAIEFVKDYYYASGGAK